MQAQDFESQSSNGHGADATVQATTFKSYTNAERIQQLNDIDKVSSCSILVTVQMLMCTACRTSFEVRWSSSAGTHSNQVIS